MVLKALCYLPLSILGPPSAVSFTVSFFCTCWFVHKWGLFFCRVHCFSLEPYHREPLKVVLGWPEHLVHDGPGRKEVASWAFGLYWTAISLASPQGEVFIFWSRGVKHRACWQGTAVSWRRVWPLSWPCLWSSVARGATGVFTTLELPLLIKRKPLNRALNCICLSVWSIDWIFLEFWRAEIPP